jgi:threonine 3-dehydrogenase
MNSPIKTALITGGNGNLGRLTADRLLARGVKVVKFDVPGSEPEQTHDNEIIVIGDIRDTAQVESLVAEHQPDTIYHLASLLSGSSEADHTAAWEINATGSFYLLQTAVRHNVERFFFASTNASYGGKVEDPLPESAEQWPENIYGATKVAVERLGVFFKSKNNLDFRILRFPLVISPFAPPTAVTAFPSHAFRAAIKGEPFVFPVPEDVGMSTIFLDDVVSSIVDYTHAPRDALTQHAYNLHAYHLTTQMVIDEILKRYPDFQYSVEINETVQTLINNWPNVLIDETARADWGWQPAYDFPQSVERMFQMILSENA